MALSLFNDPFFSESRLTPMGNMFGSSIFDTGLGNMGIQNRMTAMPLRVTETDDKFKVSKNNYNDNFHVRYLVRFDSFWLFLRRNQMNISKKIG